MSLPLEPPTPLAVASRFCSDRYDQTRVSFILIDDSQCATHGKVRAIELTLLVSIVYSTSSLSLHEMHSESWRRKLGNSFVEKALLPQRSTIHSAKIHCQVIRFLSVSIEFQSGELNEEKNILLFCLLYRDEPTLSSPSFVISKTKYTWKFTCETRCLFVEINFIPRKQISHRQSSCKEYKILLYGMMT